MTLEISGFRKPIIIEIPQMIPTAPRIVQQMKEHILFSPCQNASAKLRPLDDKK
jgi:hypothetical protein